MGGLLISYQRNEVLQNVTTKLFSLFSGFLVEEHICYLPTSKISIMGFIIKERNRSLLRTEGICPVTETLSGVSEVGCTALHQHGQSDFAQP